MQVDTYILTKSTTIMGWGLEIVKDIHVTDINCIELFLFFVV